MKRALVAAFATILLSAGFPALRADNVQSRLEAVILVKKAVAFLKDNGNSFIQFLRQCVCAHLAGIAIHPQIAQGNNIQLRANQL